MVVGARRCGANLMFALKALQPVIQNLSATLQPAHSLCPALASTKPKALRNSIIDSTLEHTQEKRESTAIFPTCSRAIDKPLEEPMPMVSCELNQCLAAGSSGTYKRSLCVRTK